MFRLLRLLFIFSLFSMPGFSEPAMAEKSLKLKWENLMPDLTPLQNPLNALPEDLWDAFNEIIYWKRLQQILVDPESREELRAAEKKAQKAFGVFQSKGVEINDIFKQREVYLNEVEKRKKIVVRKYDGEQITISGYLLPLEFSDTGVKEFLLVPYVGACIHVPSPPANQMIYVKSDNLYKFKDVFEAVTVSGTLNTEAFSKKLSLVDGSQMVDTGYKMQASTIEIYSDPEKSKW